MCTPGSTPPTHESPVDDPSRRRLPPLLRRTWYSLNQAFRRRIAHLQITPDQFTVLRWLSEEGSAEDEGAGLGADAAADGTQAAQPSLASRGITQRRLADLMASDPNTVTSVLNRMEASGLIERRQHHTDRRAKLVQIKPKGRRVYEQGRQVAVELQSQVMQVLPKAKRQQFLEQLEIVADAARRASDAAPPSKD
jgi:DNA-binding MarR family transcriptional regulator